MDNVVIAAAGRSEGLAVLAWALQRFDLPDYDVPTYPSELAQQSIGFGNQEVARSFLDSAALRPTSEIDRFATHATVVGWRLRQFAIQPGPMDLVAFLRRFSTFQETWLGGLRIVDGDLALGARPISQATAEEIQRCQRSAVERQIAAYWLQGDDPVYSRVDPATMLSAC